MKSAKTPVPILPIESLLLEYDALRAEKKRLEDRLKVVGDDIKAIAKQNGIKDEKGSFYADTDEFQYGCQARKTISFNDKALPFLKNKRFLDCIDTVEVINEANLETYINAGKITLEDLEDITSEKVVYSVSVIKKDKVAEATQYAASAKNSITPTKRK